MASKTLLAAVKLNLFTELGYSSLAASEIKTRLNLQERGLYDFLDALHSLGFLTREGAGETARYGNTEETGMFLNRHSAQYIGGILELSNDRLYRFWGDLEEGLRTGKPQNEIKHTRTNQFERFYQTPDSVRGFLEGMAGAQMGNFMAFARQFDFSRYGSLCDIGGAGGELSMTVARYHPHLSCTSFDLPAVEPIAASMIEKAGYGGRVRVMAGDFFTDDFPSADVITMGNVLHDWGREDKRKLMKKAYAALPPDGALAVIECILDDERRSNTYGLLVSLTMLIETHEGYDMTFAEFTQSAREIGFRDTGLMPLTGPVSAAIAYK